MSLEIVGHGPHSGPAILTTGLMAEKSILSKALTINKSITTRSTLAGLVPRRVKVRQHMSLRQTVMSLRLRIVDVQDGLLRQIRMATA